MTIPVVSPVKLLNMTHRILQNTPLLQTMFCFFVVNLVLEKAIRSLSIQYEKSACRDLKMSWDIYSNAP